jgi:hypothetical protein
MLTHAGVCRESDTTDDPDSARNALVGFDEHRQQHQHHHHHQQMSSDHMRMRRESLGIMREKKWKKKYDMKTKKQATTYNVRMQRDALGAMRGGGGN